MGLGWRSAFWWITCISCVQFQVKEDCQTVTLWRFCYSQLCFWLHQRTVFSESVKCVPIKSSVNSIHFHSYTKFAPIFTAIPSFLKVYSSKKFSCVLLGNLYFCSWKSHSIPSCALKTVELISLSPHQYGAFYFRTENIFHLSIAIALCKYKLPGGIQGQFVRGLGWSPKLETLRHYKTLTYLENAACLRTH